MGESGAPYTYPNRPLDTDFNPREFSEKASSYASSTHHRSGRARHHTQGPLLDFNRHPDSWMVIQPTYREQDVVLPSNFRCKVVTTRWVQLVFRIVQVLAACGLFVCAVCVKGTGSSQSWILRIPAPWDAIISSYAIYHLCRSADSRPPASSASYHWFAFFMDAGLIPFYVYAIIFSRANYIASPDADGRWTTLFNSDNATNIVLLTAWITSSVLAGTHLISTVLDVCLALWFRKVTGLPPDMNPLADSAKARSVNNNRHKHKTSDVSIAFDSREKVGSVYAQSHSSSSTTSQTSLNRKYNQSQSQSQSNMVPFAQTRINNPRYNYMPHTAESVRPRSSHHSLHSRSSRHSMAAGDRTSRASVTSDNRGRSRSRSRYHNYERETTPQLPPLPVQTPIFAQPLTDGTEDSRSAAESQKNMTQEQRDVLKDNWFITEGESHDHHHHDGEDNRALYESIYADAPPSPRPHQHEQQQPAQEPHFDPLRSNQPDLPKPVSYYTIPLKHEDASAHEVLDQENALEGESGESGEVGRALTMGSSLYSESIISPPDRDRDNVSRNRYYGALGSSNIHLMDVPLQARDNNRNTSTGAEIMGGYDMAWKRGSRFVSGKVAEEGLGGQGDWTMRRRDISGAAGA